MNDREKWRERVRDIRASGMTWWWWYSQRMKKVCFAANQKSKWVERYWIYLLYFDLRPGQKCHSKVMHRKEATHYNGSYERKLRGRKLADEMGRGKKKFPWYTHRLMHRNRVTCELHDDQTCDFKDRVGDWVDVELLYNSVKTEVKQFQLEIGRSYRRDVVRKATPGRRGLGPCWVGVQRRCW